MNKLKSKSQLVVLALLVGVILILANTLLSRGFFRWDLTEDKEYTLAPATKKILKELDDKITIRLFFTKKVPAHIKTVQDQITDILTEYRTYSRSRVNVEWVVPEESPQKEQEAQMMGIPPIQLNVIEADKQEVSKAYLGLAVLYADKKEILPLIADLKNFEYNLTSVLVKLTSKKIPKLGLVTPAGEPVPGMGYTNLESTLAETFDIKKFDFNTNDLSKEDLSTLLVVGPKQLPDTFIPQLEALFDAGIPVIILGGNVEVGQNLVAGTITTGLDDWLEKKGLTLVPGLLFDPENAGRASFSSGMVRYLLPYPYFIKIGKEGLNKENPATNQLESVMLAWTNTMNIKTEEHPDWKYTTLLSSSDASFVPDGELRVDPQSMQEMEVKAGEKHVLGVVLEIPDVLKPKKLVFVPNNNFVRDNFSTDNPENVLFIQNLSDWMSWGGDLIGIRSRGKTTRPIQVLSSPTISAIRWSHMILVPLAFIGVGMVANMMRKRRYRFVVSNLG